MEVNHLTERNPLSQNLLKRNNTLFTTFYTHGTISSHCLITDPPPPVMFIYNFEMLFLTARPICNTTEPYLPHSFQGVFPTLWLYERTASSPRKVDNTVRLYTTEVDMTGRPEEMRLCNQAKSTQVTTTELFAR